MKAVTVLAMLQDIIAQHGNVEVFVKQHEGGAYVPVATLRVLTAGAGAGEAVHFAASDAGEFWGGDDQRVYTDSEEAGRAAVPGDVPVRVTEVTMLVAV